MLIPHVVSTEADKVFVNILNNQSSALSDGDLVCWNTSSPDGVRTTQPSTNILSLFVGVADGAIAASAYGLAQAYGYKSTVAVINSDTVAIAAGDILVPVNAADYAKRSAASDGKTGFLFAGAAVATDTTPAATTAKGFIRAL